MAYVSFASLALLVTFAACTSESEPDQNDASAGESGAGPGGTSAGGNAAGGSSGASGRSGSAGVAQGGSETGGAGGTEPAGGMGGVECRGDETVFAELTRGPIPCERNSDCCVVIEPCLSEGRLVRAGDEAAASRAWPSCDDYCVDCYPPKIVVGCYDGVCVGTAIDDDDFGSPLRVTHCGIDEETTESGTSDAFNCGS